MQTLVTKTEEKINEKDFIKFLNDQDILVKTNTKARGNLGICFKNRIDISKHALKERRISILAHEYAHKIHLDLEKNSLKCGGSLKVLFDTTNTENLTKELLRVTHFVDNNSLFLSYHKRKKEISSEIKHYEGIIKQEYPDFKRSQTFKPVNTYFKKTKSNAKYLLKHENVRIISPFTKREELLRVKNIDTDFPEIPVTFRAYIKLISLQREQRSLSRRKNKAEKYYLKSTELFARFVEGLFINSDTVKNIAPLTYERFMFLLKARYYGNLKDLLKMAQLV